MNERSPLDNCELSIQTGDSVALSNGGSNHGYYIDGTQNEVLDISRRDVHHWNSCTGSGHRNTAWLAVLLRRLPIS